MSSIKPSQDKKDVSVEKKPDVGSRKGIDKTVVVLSLFIILSFIGGAFTMSVLSPKAVPESTNNITFPTNQNVTVTNFPRGSTTLQQNKTVETKTVILTSSSTTCTANIIGSTFSHGNTLCVYYVTTGWRTVTLSVQYDPASTLVFYWGWLIGNTATAGCSSSACTNPSGNIQNELSASGVAYPSSITVPIQGEQLWFSTDATGHSAVIFLQR